MSGVANLNVAAGGEAISSARFVVGYDDVASISTLGTRSRDLDHRIQY